MPTLVSGGIDVQHKTTPRRGTEGSNGGRCGCEVIEAAGEGRAGPLEPLFTSIARHERRERLRLREFEGKIVVVSCIVYAEYRLYGK